MNFIMLLSPVPYYLVPVRPKYLPLHSTLEHCFDVLLAVHLSIILAVNQLNAQNLLL